MNVDVDTKIRINVLVLKEYYSYNTASMQRNHLNIVNIMQSLQT